MVYPVSQYGPFRAVCYKLIQAIACDEKSSMKISLLLLFCFTFLLPPTPPYPQSLRVRMYLRSRPNRGWGAVAPNCSPLPHGGANAHT